MKSSYYIQCVLLTCACITTTSYADCVADISVADAKRYFQQGSQLEIRGDVYAALVAYNTAQGYVCEDGGNPVAKSASQKASALGLALGEKAERQGHFYTVDDNKPGAFQYYEAGAHFAAADRMLVAALQQDPANRSLSATAQEHFRTRGEAYFTANNAMRLAVSGAYRLNPDHVRYVQSLPRINIDQLLKQASAQLPDTYLLEYRQLEEQKEKLEPSDFVYADPPYDVEITKYSKDGFTWDDQLATAEWLSKHKGPVILSNQATTRILNEYKRLGFALKTFEAPRKISCTGDRSPATEVLAIRNLPV